MTKRILRDSVEKNGSVKFLYQSRPGKFDVRDMGGWKPEKNEPAYEWTRSLRSIADMGIHECIHFEPHDDYRDIVESNLNVMEPGNSILKIQSHRELLNKIAEPRKRVVSAKGLETFFDLWMESVNDKFSDFANQFGLLFDSNESPSRTSQSVISPVSEPTLAWRNESYILSITYHAIKIIRKLDGRNLSRSEYQTAFRSEMKPIWAQRPQFLNSVGHFYWVHVLINGETQTELDLDWNEVVSSVINYYLGRLTKPALNLKQNKKIELTPYNLLGAMWLYIVSTYWMPSADSRFCISCGANLEGYPRQTRYCAVHNTFAEKQRRKRLKKKLQDTENHQTIV